MKAQSAMEYLMTYGWTILIVAIVLATLYALGVFSPSNYVLTYCTFPADFSCLSGYLTANGMLQISIEQSTSAPINITAIGCNANRTPSHMITFSGPNQIPLNIG